MTREEYERRRSEIVEVGLPVRTTLLQNSSSSFGQHHQVGLPVRTTLLQNYVYGIERAFYVGLPVRTTLLQNEMYDKAR